jgi:hypothetical protein
MEWGLCYRQRLRFGLALIVCRALRDTAGAERPGVLSWQRAARGSFASCTSLVVVVNGPSVGLVSVWWWCGERTSRSRLQGVPRRSVRARLCRTLNAWCHGLRSAAGSRTSLVFFQIWKFVGSASVVLLPLWSGRRPRRAVGGGNEVFCRGGRCVRPRDAPSRPGEWESVWSRCRARQPVECVHVERVVPRRVGRVVVVL